MSEAERRFPVSAAGNRWLRTGLWIAAIVLANLLGGQFYVSWDLTEARVYSLSEASRQAVRDLRAPLTVRVFFSEDLPSPYHAVARYVTEILAEYERHGDENFRYEFVDVAKERNLAHAYGIKRIQIQELREDRFRARAVYMGVAVVHGQVIERIAELTEPSGIEIRLTELMQRARSKHDSLMTLEAPIEVALLQAGGEVPPELDRRVRETVHSVGIRHYDKLDYRGVRAVGLEEVERILREHHLDEEEVMLAAPSGSTALLLVLELSDRKEAVPILAGRGGGQGRLDERLVDAVNRLISTKPSLGLAVGHGEGGEHAREDGELRLQQILADRYRVMTIDLTREAIPHAVRTVIVQGPRLPYGREALAELDRHLMRGGSALFLVDQFEERPLPPLDPQSPPMSAGVPVSHGLDELLAHYGVRVDRNQIFDFVSYRVPALGDRPLFHAPIVSPDRLAREHIITRHLERLLLSRAASVRPDEPRLREQGVEATVLARSSGASWVVEEQVLYSAFLAPPFQEELASHPLAVAARGRFPSFFDQAGAHGSPGAREPLSSTAAAEARLVVIGTSDIATPQMVDAAGNSPTAVFLQNAVDWLQGDEGSPVFRAKSIGYRRLLPSDRETRATIKAINMIGLPLATPVAGLAVWGLVRVRRRGLPARLFGEPVHG